VPCLAIDDAAVLGARPGGRAVEDLDRQHDGAERVAQLVSSMARTDSRRRMASSASYWRRRARNAEADRAQEVRDAYRPIEAADVPELLVEPPGLAQKTMNGKSDQALLGCEAPGASST